MKLIKPNKKLTLLAALTVLLALTFVLAIAVYAAPIQHDLTIHFNSDECSVYYRVNQGEWKEMVSNTPYPIDRGSTVEIKVDTKKGYTVDSANGSGAGVYLTSDPLDTDNQLVNSGVPSFGINVFDTAKTYHVRCANRTYDIQYVSHESNGSTETALKYTFLGEKPAKKTYKEGLVNVPAPTLRGYTFQHWEVVNVSAEGTIGEPIHTFNNNMNDDAIETSTNIDETGIIYLRPKFTPDLFNVTRLDYVYLPIGEGGGRDNTGEELGRYSWLAAMDSLIKGDDDSGDPADPGHNGYLGYRLREGMYDLAPGFCKVTYNEGDNNLIRYYDPITYKVLFTNYYTMPNGVDVDSFNHVYNRDTALPVPVRNGYVFSGWKVTVDGAEVGTVSAADNKLAAKTEAYAAQDEQITLEAIWTPEKYTIVYVDVDPTLNPTLPLEHTFDTPTAIDNPKRVGYVIKGWYVNGDTTNLVSPVAFTIAGDQSTWDDPATTDEVEKLIRLQAVWEPKQLSVVFDGNGGGDTVYGVDVLYDGNGAPKDKIVFDSLLEGLNTKVPTRIGYTFVGYFTEPSGGVQYFDADGQAMAGAKWTTDSLDDSNIVKLYAHWVPNTYNLFLNIDKTLITSLKINGVEYLVDGDEDGAWDDIGAIAIDYRQTIEIIITAKDGYKVVNFKNQAVTHTKVYTVSYQHLTDDNLTIGVVILQMREPNISVDYPNETLTNNGAVLNGSYTIYNADGSVWFTGEVTDGKFQIADTVWTAIPQDFFGKTIQIVWHGDGMTTADSDPVDVVLAARPVLSPDQWFEVHEKEDHSIEVSIPVTAEGKYEFTISKEPVLSADAVWQSSNIFTAFANGDPFTPGTTYYVFVRIKATATEPHSTHNGPWEVTTLHLDFINQLKAELNASRQDGDGEYVQAILDGAKAALDALSSATPLSPAFYEEAMAVVANAKAELPLARERDKAAERVRNQVKALLDTGAYGVNGEIELNLILNKTILDLTNADDKAEIDAILNRALKDLAAVKVNSLSATDSASNANVQIIAPNGMSPDAQIGLSRIADIKLLSGKVSDAIRAGKIIVTQEGITNDQMLKILGTQEVVAAFKLMVYGEKTDGGIYEVRLLIPEDLRVIQNLQVGYYDDTTGELKLFETHIDGDYLVFTADKLADFVIIGDPNVSLTAMIAILGGTLLLQLIAIIYLLIRRKKVAKTVRLHSTVLPAMALTIRFLPVYGLPVVILLGVLVVIAQIVLIILLLQSDIIRRRPNDTVTETASTEKGEDAEVAYDEATDDMLDAPVLIPVSDADSVDDTDTEEVNRVFDGEENDAYQYAYESEQTDEAEEQYASAAEETESDPFAIYDETEAQDEMRDFIEPAANPRYSLPEEDEETPASEETEETGEDEEVYDEVDWAEADDTAELPDEPAEDQAFFYELADDEEVVPLYEEELPAQEGEEPQLYALSFEADDSAEETFFEETELTEQTEDAVAFDDAEAEQSETEDDPEAPTAEPVEEAPAYEEDPYADIDDSHLANDEVYTEEEVEDIDDSKEQYQ